jgi:2-keto-4-pentenoate hydratase/2-oxohepta-3-ene-1,7-dioic acid hydratase in catechol pathway
MRFYRVEQPNGPRFARATGDDVLELLDAAPWSGGRPTGEHCSLSTAQLLTPVTPSKIVCVGRNYRAHAKELGNEVPAEPLLFLKPPSALLPPGAAIRLPPESQRVEHEGEIGVVIGTRLHNVDAQEAVRSVFGITAVNDVTARDIQKREVQFTRAKSFDTFCPVGPCVATGLALEQLSVRCSVNGQLRQHGNVEQMVFGIGALLSFISRIMTLEPGDLISTGTPEGVGPLLQGDKVEVEVVGVGVLTNGVR